MLTGINRSDPSNLVADGTARDIINLRPKDGAYRPVGAKTAGLSVVGGDIAYIHDIDERFMAVFFYDTAGEVWKYTCLRQWCGQRRKHLPGLQVLPLKTISSLNAAVVMVLETAGR